jgi:hypothetical protein
MQQKNIMELVGQVEEIYLQLVHIEYQPGGCGTQTAGLSFGGNPYLPPSPSITNTTEEYDGSAWTAGGTMATTKRWSIWSRHTDSWVSYG